MKINPTAAYQAYNKISEHSHAARRLGAASELPAQKAEIGRASCRERV